MISAARRENSRSLAGVRRNHIRSLTKSTVEIYMRGIYIDFAICHYIFHTTPIVRNGEKRTYGSVNFDHSTTCCKLQALC